MTAQHLGLLIIPFALLTTACEGMKNPNPGAPTTGFSESSGIDAAPVIRTSSFDAEEDVNGLSTIGPSTGPNTRFVWDSSQYTFRLTITNTGSTDVRGVLLPFTTDYAQGHPQFLTHQTLHKPGIQDVVVAKGATTKDVQPYSLPNGPYCLQVDFLQGVTKAQVLANPAKYHPSVYGATTWKIGKTRTASGSCKAAVTPPPPPPPPVVPPVVVPPVVVPPVVVPPVVVPPVIPPVVVPPVVVPPTPIACVVGPYVVISDTGWIHYSEDVEKRIIVSKQTIASPAQYGGAACVLLTKTEVKKRVKGCVPSATFNCEIN